MIARVALANSLAISDEFVEEDVSYSTADLARVEFSGETQEWPEAEVPGTAERRTFRLIDGELRAVKRHALPPRARPLTNEAGILKIVGLGTR